MVADLSQGVNVVAGVQCHATGDENLDQRAILRKAWTRRWMLIASSSRI